MLNFKLKSYHVSRQLIFLGFNRLLVGQVAAWRHSAGSRLKSEEKT